jgi:signal peptidase
MITKIIKQIVQILKFFITLIIIAIIGVIVVQRVSNNNISLAGFRIFTVVTESMVPEYEVGDVILVKEKDKSKITVGEDVAYLGEVDDYADKVITHRVIEIESDENGNLNFHTQGIANENEDPVVSEDQIYGVVIAKMQIVTFLNGIINNMYGMYFLIVIPLAVIFFTEMKAFKENKEENDEDGEDDKDDEKGECDDKENKDDNNEESDDKENKEGEKVIDKKAKKRKEKRAKRREKYM